MLAPNAPEPEDQLMKLNRPLAVLAGAALALGPALPAAADHDVEPARIGGDTRYSTAADIALASHSGGASEVIVALGENYPDALAGAPVAAELDAPILLTRRDEVPDSTVSALSELSPDHVIILGGPDAVSEQVAAEIAQSLRVQTTRIEGDTRYATAARAAAFVQERNDDAANFPSGQRAVFLTTGENFPDAVTAGAPAARSAETPIPVLLTRPDEIPAETQAVIDELGIELVVIVGGPDAVSEQVEAQIEDDDTTTDRVWGDTRTATATAMADFAMEHLEFQRADIELTRGDLYPDALTVAPLAGANHSPILLTEDRDTLSQPTHDWLATQCQAVERIRAVGLETAVTTVTLEAAVQAATDCHGEGTTQQDYMITPPEIAEQAPGESVDFEAIGRYDEGPIGQVDIVLYPCDTLPEPTDGDFRLRDDDEDGVADEPEATDEGEAVITHVEGAATETDFRAVRPADPEADSPTRVTVNADAPDCAVVVFFDDANDDEQLNLDADGYPTEDWGIGVSRWTAG